MFGAGKGKDDNVELAKVTGNTTIVMNNGAVKKSVYGGGELSQVGGSTSITVGGGTIGTPMVVRTEPVDTTRYGGAVYGNIYGGGLGKDTNVRFGLVQGNTTINVQNTLASAAYAAAHDGVSEGDLISSPTVLHNIYGGGANGSVGTYTYASEAANAAISSRTSGGVATINITGGTIGYDGHNNGMVFGSSRGDIYAPNTIYDNLAWVYDTHVNIGTENDATTGPRLWGSVYGSGENGHTWNNTNVTIYSGTIGDPEHDYPYRGNVYGGGCGTDMYYSNPVGVADPHNGNGDKYNPLAGIVKNGNATVIINGGNVANNVYGAGSMGKVGGSTSVTINTNGAIGVDGEHDDGNVYGAARGELDLKENGLIPNTDDANNYSTANESNVTLTKGTVKGSLYGGGKAGEVTGAVSVTLNGGTVKHDVYGGGALAKTNTAYDSSEHPTYKTTVTLAGTTVEGNLYGGGLGRIGEVFVLYTAEDPETQGEHPTHKVGDVKTPGVNAVEAHVNGPVKVVVTAGSATNVFGCNNLYGAPQVSDSVVIEGGTITHDVFGGGNKAAYGHNTSVKMTGGQADRIFGGGSEADVAGSVSVVISGGKVVGDVYGGGALAETNTANWVKGSKDIYIEVVGLSEAKYSEKTGLAVGSSLKGLYTRSGTEGSYTYTEITSDATTYDGTGTYYEYVPASSLKGLYSSKSPGGLISEETPYTGGGPYYELRTINGDWATGMNAASSVPIAGRGPSPTTGGTKHKTLVTLTGGVVGNVYGGGLGRLGTGAIAAQAATYYTTQAEVNTQNASLDGAITTSTVLTAEQATALNAIPGVSKTTYAADEHPTEADANKYNTTLKDAVKIGDIKTPQINAVPATEPVVANVYGDVRVSINRQDSIAKYGGSRVAFTHNPVDVITTSGKKVAGVPTEGRVFGCNNLNGCPMGDVLVEVYGTRPEDGSVGHKNYEIQAVYGGGDQAAYLPNEGKNTYVVIDGCGETSISRVYGGGNSAAVPGTDVTIWGSYDIEYAFGGGNGSQPVKQFTNWVDNSGADVNGAAKITCHGGKIGQVFGGSDAKGDCRSTNPTLEQAGGCPLVITKLYGAGSEANVDGDVNVVIAACSDAATSQIEYVCGGSYKAHISGDVTLTITSGYFKNVYGGNDERGGIGGNITVNIEETDDCSRPIIIGNLVGGGNRAKYPGTDKDEKPFADRDRTITVNVKSATRIDNVYGGSYIEEAIANTKVNINMVKGNKAGNIVPILLPIDYEHYSTSTGGTYHNISNIKTAYVDITGSLTRGTSSVVGYYLDAQGTTPAEGIASLDENIHYYEKQVTGDIANYIGTIGNVFGGGQHGKVIGSTEVNIGTETSVDIMDRDADHKIKATYEAGKITHIDYVSQDVRGAHITGDVYGGGEEADVTGNTVVNICATKVSDAYTAVTIAHHADNDNKPVTIGGSVYGGGKGDDDTFECEKAMVGKDKESEGVANPDGKGTNVRIGNGTIKGNVFGGGEIGRVEWSTAVTIGLSAGAASAPVIEGNVFGAGKGVYTHGYSGLVRGNSAVTIQADAKVGQSVYGGGEKATVGRYLVVGGIPTSPVSGGKCTVVVQGNAEIGPDNMEMPTFSGNVFGAGKGVVAYEGVTGKPWSMKPTGQEFYNDTTAYLGHLETLGLASNTDVTIDGNAFVKGSVYGGAENGFVQADTHVRIKDGQIGCGRNTTRRHVDDIPTVWADNYTPTDANNLECNSWPYHAPYAPYDVNADTNGKYVNGQSADGGQPASGASDGHTYYGNVFGGGSGKDPIAPGKWHRKAGSVGGNTVVDITGGHILTSVYGGNEMTDVGKYHKDNYGAPVIPETGTGSCTVNMTGGTLGVPRTATQIAAHPVTCYLFGAGKGDQRIFFNTWTNVISTEVNISGDARIYGSTFGGGEDGHVMANAETNIGGTVNIDLNGDGDTLDSGETFTAESGLKIGTTGTSYVDGNVFGGGRGFSGEAQTAGTVGGNVNVTISNGTILGSVYGGGRLASVGTYFTDVNSPTYGQFQENVTEDSLYTADDQEVKDKIKNVGDIKIPAGTTYGNIVVNITGGTIGNTGLSVPHVAGAKYSGNVFGGCMGRLTLLDGSINPLWPELAEAKTSTVTISGSTHITRNVYGGGEYGTVRDGASVCISGSVQVDSCVYGAGYGSNNHTDLTPIEIYWNNQKAYYAYTPMQWAGLVGGNTSVSIAGGTVGQNVYGGGELASVGVIDYSLKEDSEHGTITYKGKKFSYNSLEKHDVPTDDGSSYYDFGLSWPYKFTYVPCNPDGLIGGKATVSITGSSKIGSNYDENNGFVYGAGKGKVWFGATEATQEDITEQRYKEAFCANVKETEVTIETTGESEQIRTVYGGGEDGHVYTDTKVTINSGKIARTVFGGGKGTGLFSTTLLDENSNKKDSVQVYSWTSGRVYGNTSVTMNGGSVGWFVYGGGNMGSVGKGNYSGGTDDYSEAGYGELPPKNNDGSNGPLWTNTDFLNSGKSTVTIIGGTVGTSTGDQGGIPKGSVFGGSRGKAAKSMKLSPRFKYVPDFFMGYVNNAYVNIGGTTSGGATAGSGPIIKGSVYGGGQDGHVRNSTEVRIFKGDIHGQDGDSSGRSGHVFGAGSGIGTYQDGDNNYCNYSSGSVTCTTLVEVMGDTITTKIAGNVYGGGAMASVGPPFTGQKDKNNKAYNEHKDTTTPYDEATPRAHASKSYSQVDIKGGKISGSVFGASRGPSDSFIDEAFTQKHVYYEPDKFATDIWSFVNITGGKIKGNVYGGGEGGRVKEDTNVQLTGGIIVHDAFGGGKGTDSIASHVLGNTLIELNKGVTSGTMGCIVERVFGCNDFKGSPKGHVKVHVHATQNSSKANIGSKFARRPTQGEEGHKNETFVQYLERLIGVANAEGVSSMVDGDVIAASTDTWDRYKNATSYSKADSTAINTAIDNVIEELGNRYDVKAVYGGGNLAQYQPYGPAANDTEADYKLTTEETEVIIDGCSLTSIKQVYGGGNAAPVPATNLTVTGTYEIEEVFGGGNGKDNYQLSDGKYYRNPGANVGYYNYTHYDKGGSHGSGASGSPYEAIENANATNKAQRQAYYLYGRGVASTDIMGGRIHYAYGGSNEKGNISKMAMSIYDTSVECPVVLDKTCGAGKNAEVDGDVRVSMECVNYTKEQFGGSTTSDVNSDITLIITNGHFGKVFGGNDKTGKINGSITVKVQESGCQPIVIDELYGGGYDAAYSIYGYNDDGSPRTKAQFEKAYNTAIEGTTTEEAKTAALLAAGLIGLPYNNPQVLVVSASKIGSIYGGGEGYNAKMVGDTHVNVNMTNGKVPAKYANTADNEGKYTAGESYSFNDGNGLVTYAVTAHPTGGDATLAIGTIDSIYGGGNMAAVVGDTYVEIGTGTQHNEDGELETITPARNAAKITGNVYGGGKGEAPSDKNNAFAFTCASAMIGEEDSGEGSTHVVFENGTIGGNVYGGGKIARVEKNTSVTIGKEGDTTNEPIVSGYVFGAGQGVATHGYSGLARGNSTVTLQGRAKIRKSVYGGGQMATVGKYVINSAGIPTTPDGGGKCTVVLKDSAEVGPNNMVMHNTTTGKPDDYGHVFGAGKGVTPYEGVVGNPWRMTKDKKIESYTTDSTYLAYLETLALVSETEVTIGGHAWVKGDVFGGSENGRVQTNTWVKIQDDCQIGNGYAQMADDGTYLDQLASPVTPVHVNRRYSEAEWTQGHLITVESDPDALKTLADTYYKNSLPECASWKYGQAAAAADKHATYDPFAKSTGYYDDGGTKSTEGGRPVGDDGSTFYGNVFGGGSGYYPYAAGKWHWEAGQVGGSTLVEITGGHIMTSVYGGNELTNVSDTATVRMSGGTVGVPRTLGQIIKHPVTCYLFGGGKGDPRIFLNKQTNVMETEVTVTDGIIYGSVFGGAEDGHVERNTTVTIGEVGETGPKIGTLGTSYVDGNIFGGGRGYTGEAYTAGNVAGAVKMTINSGTMRGSIYGGGRLGSVGYGLYMPNEKGYGLIRDDDKKDNGTVDTSFFTKGRGHVDVTINGGTIGNELEYKYFTSSVNTTGMTEEQITEARATELNTIKTTNDITQTDLIFDPDSKSYRLIHTRGGNVFAGGMGRMYKMDGSTPISDVKWEQLGNVKSTKLTINGGTIKGNVYGGCELGWVQGKHRLGETTDSVGTEILITGGTIGTEIKDAENITRYTFGSVFGGGRGDNTEKLTDAKSRVTNPKFIAGRVVNSTHVEMQDGAVLASVYGGGETGNVGMGTSYGEDGKNNPKVSTNVTISGGTIGKDTLIVGSDTIRYGGEKMGNVYGGGSGDRSIVRCGLVLGNSNVNISQAEGKTTRIYHNIYGGGAYGSVGDFDYEKRETSVVQNGNTVSVEKVFGIDNLHTPGTGRATVNITGGTIGVDGHENGMVFGSSRGEVVENYPRDDYMAWVYDAYVTIGDSTKGTKKGGTGAFIATPQIRGSIYGSGENGHTLRNTFVNIHSGYVGDTVSYYAYRGNVYGGGCGTDYYLHDGVKCYKPWAGIVRGNTNINIDGGLITGCVYGAGAMASVGTITNATDTVTTAGVAGIAKHLNEETSFALSWPYKFVFADTTGTATINITGGHIGIKGTDGGDVYGSARGTAGERYIMAHHAYVKKAVVNVDYPSTAAITGLGNTSVGCITGSVHGSGEDGYVYDNTYVTLNKGLIGHSIYGGGKGKGTYEVTLHKIVGEGTYPTNIESVLSGRVMGNAYVTMNDGHVLRNVYGGGNLGSVGKGNYAGGADDYYTGGYGENITGNLWTSASDGDDAWEFLNSGKTTVNVFGGTVGYIDSSDPTKSFKNNLPYGNVFGGSTGESAPNVPRTCTPRYKYCPAFFSGYVNETDVNIGGYRCKTAYGDYKIGDLITATEFAAVAVGDTAKWSKIGPTIYASVYGGGQDGHVRRDTKVTVNSGEIGIAFTEANRKNVMKTWGKPIDEELDNPLWLHRGNVFGAGSGISKYKFDFNHNRDTTETVKINNVDYKEHDYSTSAGSVTGCTDVRILGGTIHRNVYGGGSLASVGAPPIPPTRTETPYKPGVTTRDGGGTIGQGWWSQCHVTIGGAGTANVGTPSEYQIHYGGEVYGASRGQSDADSTQFGSVVWTLVNVKNGAVIQGNVYGGGDNGNVKRDTDVRVGEKTKN